MAVAVLLVLRALGLGDLLTGVPALRGLRRAYPDHRLLLATPPELAGLALATGAVDQVVPARGLAPLTGPAGPDVAVNLHGRGPESHRLLRALRPRRLVAFRSAEAGHAEGPAWRPGEYEVARWCRMLAAHGIPSDPADLALPPPPTTRPGHVVVHPGAAHPRRRWPAERFAAVATALRRQGHSVVVTGGPAERSLARTVADRAGVPALADLTLLELVSLIGRARLVVCGDTGVAHVASNYRTPSVLLFGPVSPANWGPPAGGPHRVLWHGDGTGDAHGQQADPALLAITVEEVLTAAEELVPSEAALPG